MKQLTSPNGNFTLSVPGNWQAQTQGQGVAAMDPATGAGVMAMAAPKAVQSLQQFVQMMLQQSQQSIPGWQVVGQEAIQVGGKPGYRVRATGSPNNQALYAEYVMVLGGTNQYMLMMQCPQQAQQQCQGIFQQIAAGWQVQ